MPRFHGGPLDCVVRRLTLIVTDWVISGFIANSLSATTYVEGVEARARGFFARVNNEVGAAKCIAFVIVQALFTCVFRYFVAQRVFSITDSSPNSAAQFTVVLGN